MNRLIIQSPNDIHLPRGGSIPIYPIQNTSPDSIGRTLISDNSNKILDLQRYIEKIKIDHKNDAEQLKSKLTQHQEKLDKVLQLGDHQEKLNSQLQETLNDHKEKLNHVQQLKDHRERLVDKVEKLNESTNKVREELCQSINKVQQLSDHKEKLDQAVSSVHQELITHKEKLTGLTESIDKVHQQLNDHKEQLNQVQQLTDHAHLKANLLATDLDKITVTKSEIKENVDKLTALAILSWSSATAKVHSSDYLRQSGKTKDFDEACQILPISGQLTNLTIQLYNVTLSQPAKFEIEIRDSKNTETALTVTIDANQNYGQSNTTHKVSRGSIIAIRYLGAQALCARASVCIVSE